MASGKLPWLPNAIYFDANVLVKVPHSLKDPTLQAVAAFAKKFKRDLIIPEVAWQEWVRSLNEGCEIRLKRLADDAKHVGSVLGRNGLQVEALEWDNLFCDINKAHTERVEGAGFKIIPTPDLDVRELLAEAVCRKVPFEPRDKGFRDAVILETAGRHAKKTYEEPVILFISDDKAVLRSVKRLQEKDINAVICTPAEAATVLEDSLNTAQKEIERQDQEAALKFLNEHLGEISKFVKKSQIPLRSLERRLQKDYFGVSLIKSIDGVELRKVQSASPGSPILRRDMDDDRYPFGFTIEVHFRLGVDMQNPANLFSGPSVPLDQPTTVSDLPRFEEPWMVHQEIAFDTSVYVDATVSTEGVETREFKDLQLVEVWTGDL